MMSSIDDVVADDDVDDVNNINNANNADNAKANDD
jgi:hypothetical protein